MFDIPNEFLKDCGVHRFKEKQREGKKLCENNEKTSLETNEYSNITTSFMFRCV